MRLTSESLARAAATHPWRVVAIWGVALVAALATSAIFFSSATTTEQSFTRPPEAEKALDLLREGGLVPDQDYVDEETVVIRHETLTVDDAAYQEKVVALASDLKELGKDKVADVYSYFDAPQQQQSFFASPSRHTTVIRVVMTGDVDTVNKSIVDVLDVTDGAATDGYFVGVAGAASIGRDFQEVSEKDLQVGETIGIAIALTILLLVFGAVGSAWIPIALAICAIIVAVAASALIGQAYKLSFFVINMITMIGLAVGIDYTLFIVARFREERARGIPKVDAIAKAGSTAARAVFFSGLTVIFALVGMLIVPTNIFFSLGLGAILVAMAAIILALTLLPALLSIMGDRVDAWRLPLLPKSMEAPGDNHRGFWSWATRMVLARPFVFLVITGGALIALSSAYGGIAKGFNGVETLPESFESKHAYEILVSEFPHIFGQNVSPVNVVVNGGASTQESRDGLARLTARLATDSAFGGPVPCDDSGSLYCVSEDGKVGLAKFALAVAADSERANQAVRNLRQDYVPAAQIPGQVLIGGNTAFNVDFFDLTSRWEPRVLIFVLALSFLLLMIVFRSIVVPIKAIILNLLSVGAAFGLMVLVFQKGYGADILGFQQVDVIEAWIPLFLFSVLFGLSMDYEVFLLSRIRERFDQTKNNEESVAFGLRSTASIITGAALIMVGVFAGFALGDLVMFQQMGFGLGVAVLVDATIIRSVLVPATMKLLGNANWYLPKWLSWLPDVRVEPAEQHVGVTQPRGVPAGAANGITENR